MAETVQEGKCQTREIMELQGEEGYVPGKRKERELEKGGGGRVNFPRRIGKGKRTNGGGRNCDQSTSVTFYFTKFLFI